MSEAGGFNTLPPPARAPGLTELHVRSSGENQGQQAQQHTDQPAHDYPSLPAYSAKPAVAGLTLSLTAAPRSGS